MIELNQRHSYWLIELRLVFKTVEILCVLILSGHELFNEVLDSWLHELNLVLLKQLLNDSHQFNVLVCLNVLLRAKKVTLKVDQLFTAEVPS